MGLLKQQLERALTSEQRRAKEALEAAQRETAPVEAAPVVVPPPPPAAPYQIGQTIEDKGVYLGTWEPKYANGKGFGKTYHAFVAPTDMMDRKGERIQMTFKAAVEEVANVRDLCGHDGGHFESSVRLLDSLKHGDYRGEWFIPPVELVNGKNLDGVLVCEDHFQKHWGTGDFCRTFCSKDSTAYAGFYMTSTLTLGKITISPIAGEKRYGRDKFINNEYFPEKNTDGCSIRLCRLEEIGGAPFPDSPKKRGLVERLRLVRAALT